jgi:opacity protein-like surface antigen
MRLTVIAATALALALPAVAHAGSFDGVYGGVTFGGAFTSVKQTTTSPIYSGGSEIQDSLSADGLIGGLVAGYGYNFTPELFLGAELYADFGSRDFTHSITDPTNPYKSKIKSGSAEWGFNLRPGYVVNNNVLFFGLLGFEQFSLKSTSATNEATFNKTQTAFSVGAGSEVAISGPLTFRAEYAHVFMSSINLSDSFGSSVKYEPSEDKFKIGVVYHF